MNKILILILLISSCTRDNKPSPRNSSEALATKKAFYCEQGKRVLAERGFMDDRCDSLLYTALWSTACGPISLNDFEDEELPGKWHRNPERDCYLAETGPNGSASSISRDMLLGLFHHLWSTRDLLNTAELVDYGEINNWIMGDAKDSETLLSRCLLTPQLISLLKDMEKSLSGFSLFRQSDSADALPVNTGYRAHLDVLRILLSGRVRGAISDLELSTLKAQAERQPGNALFVAAYEKYAGGNRATELLLAQDYYPNDRLPNTGDRCSNYINARDQEGADWQSCAEAPLKEHDGTDFVFAAWVVLDGR